MKFFFLIILTLSTLTFSAQAQCDVKVREAFGGISALGLFTTHKTISTLNDCLLAKVYTATKIKEQLTEEITIIETITGMLTGCQNLATPDLTPDDQLYVKEMIVCLGLLKDEASALIGLTEKFNDVSRNKFTKAQSAAWKKVASLLNIQE